MANDPFKGGDTTGVPRRRGSGLVKAAGELRGRGSLDTGSRATALNSFARSFSGMSKQVGQIADHAARKEGARAGRKAGLDPEFRPTRSNTIRGEAYDKAGLDIYRARVKQRFAADLQQAYDENASDPAALDAALKSKRDAWLEESLDDVRPELTLQFERSHLAFMRDATRAQVKRVNAEHRDAVKDETAHALREFDQNMAALGLDPAADEAAATHRAELEEILSRTGVNGEPLVSAKNREEILDGLPQRAGRVRMLSAFDRASLPEKEAMLEKWREDFTSGEGLASRYDFEAFEGITGDMETRLNAARREHNAEVRAAQEMLDTQTKAAERGLPMRPAFQQELEARVAAADDPELSQAYERTLGVLEFQDRARKMTPAQLSGAIDAQRARMERHGATAEGMARLDMADKLLGNMRSMLKDDPPRWAVRAGYDVPELDFSTRETAVATLQARAAVMEQFRDDYGLDATPWLFKREKPVITETIAQGGEQALQGLGWMVEGLGRERAIEMMAQVSDEAPQTAMLGALVARVGPVPAARDAMRTLEAKATLGEDYKSRAPSKTELRPVVTSTLGAALSEIPGAADAAVGAAVSAYEQRARRQRLDSFDAGLFRRTLREMFGERQVNGETWGGIVEYNDRKIVLPSFIRQDGFDQVMDSLTHADLAALGQGNPVGIAPITRIDTPAGESFTQDTGAAGGATVPLDRLKAATLVQEGDGRYLLALGDPSNPATAQIVRRDNANGAPFVLDLHALKDRLADRRPDLFLDPEPEAGE